MNTLDLWLQQNGETVQVKDMTDEHIMHCINMIRDRGFTWRARYLDRLILELLERSALDKKKGEAEASPKLTFP